MPKTPRTDAQPDKETTRERIIAAANLLFYAEGIRAVSVDAIAAKAGVTKKTLYYHFRSKDDLIEAYVLSRDQPNLKAFARRFAEAPGDLPDKVAALFTGLARRAGQSRWKGCGFMRTAAELVNLPGHPALKAGAAHKKKFETWLTGCLSDGGVSEAEILARRIVLLMEGAFSTLLIHRDPAYAEAGAEAARAMVRMARRPPAE